MNNLLNEWLNEGDLHSAVHNMNEHINQVWADLPERFKAIRAAYELIEGEDYNPYWFDIPMTPIESQLWMEIRSTPDCDNRYYRQFPVGKYFVDFGNPWKKIAIEADGKEYHDQQRDLERDLELLDLGWFVHRVPGKDCFKDGVINHVLKARQSN